MEDSRMPEWMKRAKEVKESREAQAENSAREQLIAQTKVESEGPAFWEELTEQLKNQAPFLQGVFGVEGRVVLSKGLGNPEESCRMDVNLRGAVPKSAYINLFYRPSGNVIRFHPQFGSGGDAPLRYENQKVFVVLGGHYRNAEEAADWIIQDLIRIVKPDALPQRFR